MNSITDLLDLEDSDINISDIIVEGQTKTLIISARNAILNLFFIFIHLTT